MAKRYVKIAAVSDIHGFLEGLEEDVNYINPHILVIAGDIHPCIIGVSAEDWFRNTFFPFVERLRAKSTKVIAIPGNHDFYLTQKLIEIENSNGDVNPFPDNFHLLCDSLVCEYGIRFYGTPWVPWINGNWCFEASNKTLEYAFSKIPYGIDILITHSPPKIEGENIDVSIQHDKRYWCHFGSEYLLKMIKDKSPRHVFCGHIHSGDHSPIKIKNNIGATSIAHNVSRVDEHYDVAYRVTTVRIPIEV